MRRNTPEFEGRVLRGTYRILRELGRGAMGVVYEAQHLRLYRRVAIKVLPRELVRNADLMARFQREAELVSRIQHRNVVSVFDSDVTEDGEPFLVLELLEGETLAARMAKSLPMPVAEAVALTSQIALGLAAAHRAEIVHRDLKPENVFLVSDPDEPASAKLLDFGIGRSLRTSRPLTGSAMIIGTPDYMAPEQAAGRSNLVDARTDQYALAVLTYEMLTGLQPFSDEDLGETLRRVVNLTAPPASSVARWLSREIDLVLARALSKDPAARYPDVTTFARALVRAAGRPRSTDATAPDRAPSVPGVAVSVVAGKPLPQDISPRSVYLLSRIENGMSVADVLDVAGMSRLEARWRLQQLEESGLIAVE